MNRRNILAHRGCWDRTVKKNSFEALKIALDSGFGIETDFRDCNGVIVVSHDPPKGDVLKARALFELYANLGAKGRIGLNIKADGLQKTLLGLLFESGLPLETCYAFDMSVPDARSYIVHGFPTYTRLSEYETEPPLLNLSNGVWVDDFTGNFAQVAEAKKILATGLRACIVSPELHGRDHLVLWNEIFAAGLHENPLFELCTDFPRAAHDFFKP
jgi:glycerophosphoryl diester phosphodiesterase